jgi:cell division protein FtsQ
MSTAAKSWLLVLLVGVLATGVAVLAPRALRRMDAYHVQQVEVLGAHYLSPADAVAATGITPTSTVFDDFELWRQALLRQPLVLDVTVTRRLPHTIVLHVTETRPLALARLEQLKPVDARGRLLDIDPTRVALDLPVLLTSARPDGQAFTDTPTLRALAALGRVAELEPELFALASEAAPLPDGVRLALRHPAGAELMVPLAPDAARLRLLRLTLADVSGARRDTTATDELPRLRRIDARYHEQIVVALKPNESP